MTSENYKMKNNKNPEEIKIVENKIVRILLIFCGFISLALGIIGILLPILPTTPFLLLSAYCFSRSSEKFHFWLLNNKVFGKYIKNYQEGKGLPLRVKITAITFLWISIMFSIIVFLNNQYIRILLIFIAFCVTFHLLKIKTLKI